MAITTLFRSASPGRADPYHRTEYHFRVDPPPNWEPFTADELTRENTEAEQVFPGMEVTIVAGFRPAGSDIGSSVIWVQRDKRVASKMTFEELERERTRDFAAARKREPEAHRRRSRRLRAPDQRPEFDRARGRFTVRGTMGRGARESHIHSAGYLGPDGLFILHAMTRNGGPEAELAPLVKASDSFQFDEPEKAPPSVRDRMFGDRVGPTGRVAIIGGGIAVLVLLLGTFVLREKPAPRWPHGRLS